MPGHGSVHWSELTTGDVEGAKAFFTTICGWTIEAMEMPNGTYNVCKQGDQPVAGIMDMGQTDEPDPSPRWTTYLEVSDVEKAVARTGKAGGTVCREPFDVPGVGRIAIVQDPGGAVVGLITPAVQG